VRLGHRGLPIPDHTVAAAVAALEAGHHIALVATSISEDAATGLAELLADCAATLNLCLGWISLRSSAGGLVKLDDVLHPSFVRLFWLVLSEPTPAAISRVMDDVRRLWRDADARLIVSTTGKALRESALSPGARRALVSIDM
jgi:hypothetical protein